MEILSINFEKSAILEINGVKIGITPFKEKDEDIIKIGIDAPKSIRVNREEIHKQLIEAQKNT